MIAHMLLVSLDLQDAFLVVSLIVPLHPPLLLAAFVT